MFRAARDILALFDAGLENKTQQNLPSGFEITAPWKTAPCRDYCRKTTMQSIKVVPTIP